MNKLKYWIIGTIGVVVSMFLLACIVHAAFPSSNQLAPNPVSGYNLQTNGSTNSWAAASAGGSGNSAFTIGSGLIYNATSTDLLGIGTITPTTTLFVQGKGGTNPFAVASSTGTSLLTITQAGNVGIGTSTPIGLLSVQGTSGNLVDVYNGATSEFRVTSAGVVTSNGNFTSAGSVLSTGSAGTIQTTGANSYFYVNTASNGNKLVMNNGGPTNYMAIGATSTAANSIMTLGYTAGPTTYLTPVMAILDSGNVGIATITPLATLHIANDASSTASTAPSFQIGTIAGSSLSANGTSLLIVKPTGNTGDFENYQLPAGTSKFKVTSAGALTAASTGNFSGQLTASNALNQGTAQSQFNFNGLFTSTNTGNVFGMSNSSNTRSPTSGTNDLFQIGFTANDTFGPSSGTATYSGVQLQGMAVNQTGSATGITRGLYFNPTITKAADYRDMEFAAYTRNLATGYAGGTLYGSLFNPYTVASSSAGTIANAQMVTIGGAPIAGSNITLTSSTALTILSNAVTASTTNAQAIWAAAPTGGTNNYAIIASGGNSGFGTTSPVGVLSSNGTVFLAGLTAFTTSDSAICQRAGGQITVDSGVSSCIVSSMYTKHDITNRQYQEAKSKIERLNVVTFTYNDSGKKDIGLLAEEVAKIDPLYAQYTTTERDMDVHHFNIGDPIAINWSAITADMLLVMQHQTDSKQTSNYGWLGLLGLLALVPLKKKLT